MKEMILGQLIKILLGMLNEEMLKKFADLVIDFAENYVIESDSKIDDKLILPLLSMIRTSFDIPDND